ncbi:MAG: hypothetical protein WDN26_10950 [Chitinophagaceae bacterium]
MLVQTVFSANVYVNKVEMNETKFRQLVDSVKKLDTTGALMTAQQKLDILVRALYRNPVRYLFSTMNIFVSDTVSFLQVRGFLLRAMVILLRTAIS